MTVDWITYAQSLTDKPVKGMLTGPVTMLEWSFVRDDQPRSETCKQLALAIRDEVEDLEAAGVEIIQVDEPAIREGLPLRQDRWDEYLDWAVHCFRLSTAVVARRDPDPDAHVLLGLRRHHGADPGRWTPTCYLIEAARSQMELLDDWERTGYEQRDRPGRLRHPLAAHPVDRGDGRAARRRAAQVLEPEQIWVNPDCGLKTRPWEEVEPALRNMVAGREAAARRARPGVLSPLSRKQRGFRILLTTL